jgi:hypothetical protein
MKERLWFRSTVVGECWVTDRAPVRRVRDDGKGSYRGIRDGDKMRPIHQVAYEVYIGPIPEGTELHHECGEKACWRPEHLTPMTPDDHLRHHALEFCKRGHSLTDDNLYYRPNPPKGWSGRECLTCKRMSNEARKRGRKIEPVA